MSDFEKNTAGEPVEEKETVSSESTEAVEQDSKSETTESATEGQPTAEPVGEKEPVSSESASDEETPEAESTDPVTEEKPTAEPVEEKETVSSEPSKTVDEPAAAVQNNAFGAKSFNLDQTVEELKELFKKRRKEAIAILAVLGVLIVSLIGYKIYSSQPKSLANEVKVEFSGYEESGTLTYNTQDIDSKLAELAYRKAGFGKDQAAGLAKKDPVVYAEVSKNSKAFAKIATAEAMIRSVRYEFDKTSGLKNGDEVTFIVTTTSKNSPVKSEKKTFTVENLKEYEKVSVDDLLKETPVVFSGFNGYGTVSISENAKRENYFNFEDNVRPTNLKNGDKVTLIVSESYINSLKSKGKVVDTNKVEVTVEGLKEIKDVKNFAALLKKNDDYSKSENKNDSFFTYTIESQGSYLKVVSDGNNKKSNGKVSLITVYKITRSGSGDSKDVSYKYYGYQAYLLKDGNLDLDTASKISNWGTKDLEGLKAELSTAGYKAYKADKN